jgi:hypothetical protein
MPKKQRISAYILLVAAFAHASAAQTPELIGREVTGYRRLADGEEHEIPLAELLERGRLAFEATWTPQDGGGRPLTNGAGGALANPSRSLNFPFNFNRVSAMDSNGCSGCHNAPFGMPGGGGDFVTGVFVAAQRFDSARFDRSDPTPLSGAFNEAGEEVDLSTIGNYRATLGMFGSGYIEMLARQMTADLQAARDSLAAGGSVALMTKGRLRRRGSAPAERQERRRGRSAVTNHPPLPPKRQRRVTTPVHQQRV